MNVRVVRFTDVDSDRLAAVVSRIEGNDGPPEGVPATGVKVLHDADQGTAVVLQFFNNADDLQAGDEVMSGMDPGDTPGTRASVDRCEVAVERSLDD